MPTQFDNDLLREGILRYKAKEFEAARRYLERALENADDEQTRAQAHYYLSLLTDDPVQKRKHLEETLAIDLGNAQARRALAILDGKLKPEQIFDPEAQPAPTAGTVEVQADRFTCPKCGGQMVYAPDGIALVCEFCQRSQNLANGAISGEQDFFLAMAVGKGHRTPLATQVGRCQGCGSEFILGAQELSAACSYCGSLHVIRQSRDLAAPDSILPLGLDQEQAALRMGQWLEKHKLEPEGCPEAPRPLYLPVWTFDIGGQIPWNGQMYKNKRLVPISGAEGVFFKDLVVPASRKSSELLQPALQSYAFSAIAPYDPRYLAGWPAEVYEMSMSDASLEARRQAVEQIRRSIHSLRGDVIDLNYSTSAIRVESFKLVLVPVWFSNYLSAGRSFRIVINGVSGAVFGETPAHGLRAWLGDLFGQGD
jgi:predicted RNA-binding Zn-ribbon protein involved in translation (DUF1610 family)